MSDGGGGYRTGHDRTRHGNGDGLHSGGGDTYTYILIHTSNDVPLRYTYLFKDFTPKLKPIPTHMHTSESHVGRWTSASATDQSVTIPHHTKPHHTTLRPVPPRPRPHPPVHCHECHRPTVRSYLHTTHPVNNLHTHTTLTPYVHTADRQTDRRTPSEARLPRDCHRACYCT